MSTWSDIELTFDGRANSMACPAPTSSFRASSSDQSHVLRSARNVEQIDQSYANNIASQNVQEVGNFENSDVEEEFEEYEMTDDNNSFRIVCFGHSCSAPVAAIIFFLVVVIGASVGIVASGWDDSSASAAVVVENDTNPSYGGSPVFPTLFPTINSLKAVPMKYTNTPTLFPVVALDPSSYPSVAPTTLMPSLFPTSVSFKKIEWIEDTVEWIVSFPTSHESYSAKKSWLAQGNRNTGRVMVARFNTNTNGYVLFQEIVGDDDREWFGRNVAMSSDSSTIVVGDGENGNNEDLWSISVYIREGANGAFELKDTIMEENAGDHFGNSIGLSSNGNTLILGADQANGGGSAYIYMRKSIGRLFLLERRIDGETAGDKFGGSVAVSPGGEMVVISAEATTYIDCWAGSTYVFVLDRDGEWRKEQRFDGEKYGENLGSQGVVVDASDSSLLIHTKGSSNNIRTYTVVCNCTIESLKCFGFGKYPNLFCQ